MPNWCHNTLTVLARSTAELEEFTAAVRPTEVLARAHYPADSPVPFAQFLTEFQQARPLVFAALVPEPSEAQYAVLEEAAKTTCYLCGGRGKRPVTEDEATAWGATFIPGVLAELPFSQRPACNACTGSGRRCSDGINAWYRWRLTNWGCKGEPLFSQPAEVMTTSRGGPDAGPPVAARSRADAHASAVYRFDTPGSPPIPFLAHAAAMFPAVEFVLAYDEPGMGFAGQARFRDGQLIEDNYVDIDDVAPTGDRWL